MRKQDLVATIARQTGHSEASVTEVLNTALDSIERSLASGDEVALSGFGTFRVVSRPARDGRNPQTGAPIRIGARKSPAFRAGASLKRAVSGE